MLEYLENKGKNHATRFPWIMILPLHHLSGTWESRFAPTLACHLDNNKRTKTTYHIFACQFVCRFLLHDISLYCW